MKWRVRTLNPRTAFPVSIIEGDKMVCQRVASQLTGIDITAYLDCYADGEWLNHLRYEPSPSVTSLGPPSIPSSEQVQ